MFCPETPHCLVYTLTHTHLNHSYHYRAEWRLLELTDSGQLIDPGQEATSETLDYILAMGMVCTCGLE